MMLFLSSLGPYLDSTVLVVLSLDEDECKRNPCKGPGAFCVNSVGSYECFCKNGFQKVAGSRDTCEGMIKGLVTLGFSVPGSIFNSYDQAEMGLQLHCSPLNLKNEPKRFA